MTDKKLPEREATTPDRPVASIEDVTVREIGISAARVSVRVDYSSRDTGVFLRYGSEARGWARTKEPTRPVRGTAEFVLGRHKPLDPGSEYRVEAALDPEFRSVTEWSRATFTTKTARWRRGRGLGVVVILLLLISVMYVLIESRDTADSDPVDDLGTPTTETLSTETLPTETLSTETLSTEAPTEGPSTTVPVPEEPEESVVSGASLIPNECGQSHLDDLGPDDDLVRWEVAVMIVLESELEWRIGSIPEIQFDDVGANDCWAGAVNVLALHEITKGKGSDPPQFGSNDPARRYEAVAFIRRAFDLEAHPTPGLQDYMDEDRDGIVAKGDMDLLLSRVVDYVSLPECWERHVLEHELEPDDELARWEVAVMVVLESELEWPMGSIPEIQFRDVTENDCWAGAVNVLTIHEITDGKSSDPPLFGSNDPARRFEAVAFIRRAFDLTADATTKLQNYGNEDRDGRVTKEDMEILLGIATE